MHTRIMILNYLRDVKQLFSTCNHKTVKNRKFICKTLIVSKRNKNTWKYFFFSKSNAFYIPHLRISRTFIKGRWASLLTFYFEKLLKRWKLSVELNWNVCTCSGMLVWSSDQFSISHVFLQNQINTYRNEPEVYTLLQILLAMLLFLIIPQEPMD